MPRRIDRDNLLPLPAQTYAVLAALAHKPNSGYEVAQALDIGLSTAYAALTMLRKNGWVHHTMTAIRGVYKLTPSGWTVLDCETQRLLNVSDMARWAIERHRRSWLEEIASIKARS